MQQYIKFQIGRIRCPLRQTVPFQCYHSANDTNSNHNETHQNIAVFKLRY